MTEKNWQDKISATLHNKKEKIDSIKKKRAIEREKDNAYLRSVQERVNADKQKRINEQELSKQEWVDRVQGQTQIAHLFIDKETSTINGVKPKQYITIRFTETGNAFLESSNDRYGREIFYDREDYIVVAMEHLSDLTNEGKHLGRAVAGGLIFGPHGALIGAATAKNKISDKSQMVFVLQNKLTKVLIEYMVPCTRTEFINNYRRIPTKPLLEETEIIMGQALSVADELLKLKGLLEDGLLTKEEFQTIKENILKKT